MKTAEIRQLFLNFFESHGHRPVASSSLVPANDPSLLFTNAGMVQFKDVFLGTEDRGFRRATSSQRCVRAGGKHNDLDNVGYTARHHTFFEMLGNFSFGDYFKREAITFAWELLTDQFNLPPEKLWITVFEDDDEAADIWLRDIGIDAQRFSRCGEKDNFWMMGEIGPCGPCSEIFYDHGADVPGGPPGSADADGDRYVEIWNLVFMQYERASSGELSAIPRPSVDTGMGLERMAAVMQGVRNNYEIDIFVALIDAVRRLAPREDLELTSLRVIADHVRSCAFLLMDGVTPSNEGRGYVLRRIIRRAARHGNKLGFDEPFFYRLVAALEQAMGDAAADLATARPTIEASLRQEEERFAETLEQGLKIFEAAIANQSGKTISGELAFKLYDTYGFPVDLTADIARERGLTVEMASYEAALAAQRERARAASQFTSAGAGLSADLLATISTVPVFCGYECIEQAAQVIGMFNDGQAIETLAANEEGVMVLDATPFYGESGGQVGDRGVISAGATVFAVDDTQKQGDVVLHYGTVKTGAFHRFDKVEAEVDGPRRHAIRLNHSATHLLHAALRQVLGEHVQQKGSLVDAERLRFDFSQPRAVSADELSAIERLVNAQIQANLDIAVATMPYQQAIESGAMALFGEKYADEVRVLRMGDFSVELCGGTHADRTGDIGICKITSETGIASGVRRIEALTGMAAVEAMQTTASELREIATQLKTPIDGVLAKIEQLMERLRAGEKEIQTLKQQLAGASGSELGSSATSVGDIRVVSEVIANADASSLRAAMDRLKDKLRSAVVVLATVEDGKVRLIAGVTKNLTATFKAGELVNFVAQQVGGKGGGRPDMAQAGGSKPEKLDDALASVVPWVEEHTT